MASTVQLGPGARIAAYLLSTCWPISITEPVARVHAGVWAQLADAGNLIGAHDPWIAATALAHGLAVVTGNRADYERVPGLRVITVV